jgi:hypothetical protein
VRALAESMKLSYLERWADRDESMLVERIRDGRAWGYGRHFIPIETDAQGLEYNQVVPVRIEQLATDGVTVLHAKARNSTMAIT